MRSAGSPRSDMARATPRRLARAFARRMAMVAVAVACVVAVLPPVLHARGLASRLEGEAAALAAEAATGLGDLAVRQPVLWRYQTRKILQAIGRLHDRPDLAGLVVSGCEGRTIYSHSNATIDGPAAQAEVRAAGRTIAYVQVLLAPPDPGSTALVALLSLLVAGVIGAGTWWWPTRIVAGQAETISTNLDRLEAADAALRQVNDALQRRVDAAVANIRELSQRVVGAQDAERARIARELHDGVGQALAAVSLELGRAPAEPALDGARSATREALAELRVAIDDLRPARLDSRGLVASLRDVLERFELRAGVEASLRHVGEGVSDPALAAGLLRVTQEALTNVARHAEASEVGVVLTVGGDAVVLAIQDDGVGFDPSAPRVGHGLANLHDRVTLLGGTITVHAAPGRGTAIRVIVPTAVTSDA